MDKYENFKDLDKDVPSPVRHKKIWTNLVQDVKHNGHINARLVADGHLTDITVESVYYWVLYLCGI